MMSRSTMAARWSPLRPAARSDERSQRIVTYVGAVPARRSRARSEGPDRDGALIAWVLSDRHGERTHAVKSVNCDRRVARGIPSAMGSAPVLATWNIIENSWRTGDRETITVASSAGGAAALRPSTPSRTGLAQPLAGAEA